LKKTYLVSEIIKFLDDENELIRFTGNFNLKITGISQHWNAREGDVSFTLTRSNEFKGSLIIIPENSTNIPLNSVLCKHPRLAFIKICQKFFNHNQSFQRSGTIIKNTFHGKNLKIGSNCTIGCEGFGHGKDENGIYQRFPHFGRVLIGDNVEIGSNVVINRGVLGDTNICDDVRIWHGVNVGHNVQIGNRSVVLNSAIICGSVDIGNGCWISPGAVIKNKIKIGYNSQVGLGAVVVKDVPNETIVAGNPARKIGEVNENTYNMRSY
jgi:UDP-3-O-[3-hydroxymyristoyl] glucosamine N-acyltransferase